MTGNIFKSERVSKTAEIILMRAIEQIFPLFGPIEEKKWADGWKPVILYPNSEKIEEGMVFTTHSQNHIESVYAWIVSKYQPGNHLIQYIVSTINRYWVITVQCIPLSDKETKAVITYTFTGINNIGNEINKQSIEKMFERDLKDWEESINYYIKTGNTKT
jgi:hypothetical protein